MTEPNKCMTCEHAVWDRTSTGRLHPSGRGTCRWTKTFALPAAMDEEAAARLKRLLSGPRWIDRSVPFAKCDTYQLKDEPHV